jgi:hypothetical protein
VSYYCGGTGNIWALSIIDKEIEKMHCRQIFPSYSSARRAPAKNSVLAKIREKRALQKSGQINSLQGRAN